MSKFVHANLRTNRSHNLRFNWRPHLRRYSSAIATTFALLGISLSVSALPIEWGYIKSGSSALAEVPTNAIAEESAIESGIVETAPNHVAADPVDITAPWNNSIIPPAPTIEQPDIEPISESEFLPPKPAASPAKPIVAYAPNEAMTQLKNSQQRWIEIRLRSQRLVAWQGDRQVYAVIVSTGKQISPTPTGTFAIQSKHRHARMQGADYDVPDVPHTMYYDGNYGIHGAYWHNSFGTPVSHGCTNVAPDHAAWLFNWAAIGTPVVVHE